MTLPNTEHEFGVLLGLDERELGILLKAMKTRDQSAKAVIKHWVRLGQMMDHFMAQGYEPIFRIGDEELDPFDKGPKMAPMPEPEEKK